MTPAARDGAAVGSGLRPVAHFTTRDTWLNDPNGLVYHDGLWHLHYQTNPTGSTWDNLSWGHATSPDLIHWDDQGIAIRHTPTEQVYSGSAVVDERNTAGFAGPGQTALVAIYTSAFTDVSSRPGIQAQSLAFSVDAGRTWHRNAGNPVLDTNATDLRDPNVFWFGGDGGHWVMVVAEADHHRVAIYASDNLHDWTLQSRFGAPLGAAGAWECPDLYPLTVRGTDDTRWILMVSIHPGPGGGAPSVQYFVGDFDGHEFVAEDKATSTDPFAGGRLDYGRDYYAAASYNGAPDGRRITMAWASDPGYAAATPVGPWRSAMSLARELELVQSAGGRLRVAQRPILPSAGSPAGLEVHRLRVPSGADAHSRITLSSVSGDVVSIVVDGTRGRLIADRQRSGNVSFHAAFSPTAIAPLEGYDTTELLIVVDGCLLEIYADDGLAVITQQVFPSSPLSTLTVPPGTEVL